MTMPTTQPIVVSKEFTPSEALADQQHGGRIDKDKRNHGLGEAEPERRVAGLERIGPGHTRPRIGGERDGRRDSGQHAIIEDEEVRHQRRYPHHGEGRRCNRHHDDIGRRGRNPAAEQIAYDRRHHQRVK
jgi:hypothetical protein